MNTMQLVRMDREKHPGKYCSKCMWNVARSGPCKVHGTRQVELPHCKICHVEFGMAPDYLNPDFFRPDVCSECNKLFPLPVVRFDIGAIVAQHENPTDGAA